MAERVRTQLDLEERFVVDYSESESTDHHHTGSETEVAEVQFLSVRECKTLFEPPSLTPESRNCFESFLSLVSGEISERALSKGVRVNARDDLNGENIHSITPTPSNEENPHPLSLYTLRLKKLANSHDKTLEIQLRISRE